MPPRGLEPTGILLVDKPAGPLVVRGGRRGAAADRREDRPRRNARSVRNGAAASCCRDEQRSWRNASSAWTSATSRTSTCGRGPTTGDPEGEELDPHEPPPAEELEKQLAGLRGEIELPIPAASAVKIGGERAYRLHRRGVAVDMPLRRSQVHALDVIDYRDGIVRLDLHVSSGTYVRAIADALGGHCVTLRRTRGRAVLGRRGRPGACAAGGRGARPPAAGGAPPGTGSVTVARARRRARARSRARWRWAPSTASTWATGASCRRRSTPG